MSPMPLIPFERFALETHLPMAEVVRRMREVVEPRRWWRVGPCARPLEGEVGDQSFEISRIITYLNLFVPQVIGRLEPTRQGTRVTATLRVHLGIAVVMALWLLMALFIAVVGVLLHQEPLGPKLVPLGVFGFGWLTGAGSFTFEAHRVRVLLERLLR
jgi:hypothetical protein